MLRADLVGIAIIVPKKCKKREDENIFVLSSFVQRGATAVILFANETSAWRKSSLIDVP
jgi:hypothetical protein